MASTPAVTFESLSRSLANGDYRPVYFIHGKEGYYTDQLVKQLENIVPEADRDFGLNEVFATQSTPEQVIDLCRQLPMMIDRQVVIVKEASLDFQRVTVSDVEVEKKRLSDAVDVFMEKTQAAIADEMGISQVQVSRMEKKIIREMRGKL